MKIYIHLIKICFNNANLQRAYYNSKHNDKLSSLDNNMEEENNNNLQIKNFFF